MEAGPWVRTCERSELTHAHVVNELRLRSTRPQDRKRLEKPHEESQGASDLCTWCNEP